MLGVGNGHIGVFCDRNAGVILEILVHILVSPCCAAVFHASEIVFRIAGCHEKCTECSRSIDPPQLCDLIF